MSIKLGVTNMGNDDMPELGETTLEQCLSEARIAGFSGIESGGMNSKELLPKLKENLQLCSVGTD